MPVDGVGSVFCSLWRRRRTAFASARIYMFALISSSAVPSVRVGKLRSVRPADLERYGAALP